MRKSCPGHAQASFGALNRSLGRKEARFRTPKQRSGPLTSLICMPKLVSLRPDTRLGGAQCTSCPRGAGRCPADPLVHYTLRIG
jgi:hypothetical protein